MRRGADGGHLHGAPGPAGRWRWLVVLVAGGALLVVSLAHVVHDHPHRGGLELSCVACTTPLGLAPAAPALAPPEARPLAQPVITAPAEPPGRAPLSFSPKQSPPASA